MEDEIIRGHFWFSEKQKDLARQVRKPPTFVRLDSGKVVECTEAMDEFGVPAFLDSRYLGEGEVAVGKVETPEIIYSLLKSRK